MESESLKSNICQINLFKKKEDEECANRERNLPLVAFGRDDTVKYYNLCIAPQPSILQI